jgi:hypothetical protein
MNRQSLAPAAAAFLLLMAGPGLLAQEVEVAGLKATVEVPTIVETPRLEAPEWGTTARGVRTVHALGFQESDSGMEFTYSALTSHRIRTGGFPWFDFTLADLPAGALLTGLVLEGCDTNAAQHVSVLLFRRASPIGGNISIGGVNTGNPETPGCALFGDPDNLLVANHTVDNQGNSYFLRAEITGLDDTTSFGAARVYYRLRVSPAPAVATFPNDVPTSHPFFRFIEALAAAGVTGGCAAGSYCPDDPISRGQMAVFLAVALGLHFPN